VDGGTGLEDRQLKVRRRREELAQDEKAGYMAFRPCRKCRKSRIRFLWGGPITRSKKEKRRIGSEAFILKKKETEEGDNGLDVNP